MEYGIPGWIVWCALILFFGLGLGAAISTLAATAALTIRTWRLLVDEYDLYKQWKESRQRSQFEPPKKSEDRTRAYPN